MPPPVLEAGSAFDLASDPRYTGIPPRHRKPQGHHRPRAAGL
jgi:hypothetical protein